MPNAKIRSRALVLLLVTAVLWSVSGTAASARAVQSTKDQRFLAQVAGDVRNAMAAQAGTRFEVNEVGVSFADYLFEDREIASSLVVEAKATCRRLNAVVRKGPKAVRAAARKRGTEIGRSDLEQLMELDADTSFTEDDKFSIGIVVGMLASSVFSNGVRVYCPRHTKQVSVLTQAWTASLSS